MSATYLGIDVGGTHIRAMSETAAIRTPISQEKVATDLTRLVQQIAGYISEHGATHTAVTLPGRVWNNRPVWVPNLPFLNDSTLVEDIRARVDSEITLVNDAQAALIAENREGVAKGCVNVALVAIGTGIGGAVLINGELYSGHTGTAGSFGWMGAHTEDATDALQPDNSGPWERSAAGTSLLEITREWATVDDFLQGVDRGDSRALEAAEDFARRLAGGFAAIASVFDPEKIVVVGGVSAVIERIRPSLHAQMSRLASPTGRRVEVVVGSLGPHAGTVGALCRAQGATR